MRDSPPRRIARAGSPRSERFAGCCAVPASITFLHADPCLSCCTAAAGLKIPRLEPQPAGKQPQTEAILLESCSPCQQFINLSARDSYRPESPNAPGVGSGLTPHGPKNARSGPRASGSDTGLLSADWDRVYGGETEAAATAASASSRSLSRSSADSIHSSPVSAEALKSPGVRRSSGQLDSAAARASLAADT